MFLLAFAAVFAAIALDAELRRRRRLIELARSCRGRVFWTLRLGHQIRTRDGVIAFRRPDKNDNGRTLYRFRVEDTARFHLQPRTMLHDLGRVLGGRPAEIGDPVLDAAYVLKNPDGSAAAALRREETRRALKRLEETAWKSKKGRGSVSVAAGQLAMTITIPRDLADDRDAFTRGLTWSRRLRDGLKRRTTAPLRIQAPRARAAPTGPKLRCPVCKDDLAGPCCKCVGCGADYHFECWSELGGCATLGCRKMYRRSTRARA